MAPRGRRPGSADTIGEITQAARRLFIQHGYRGTSLRAVAREAGVDPSLLYHYFNGKQELFGHAFAAPESSIPLTFDTVAADVAQCPPAERGACLVRSFVTRWDQPGQPERFAAIQRAIMTLGQDSDLGAQRVAAGPLGDVWALLPPAERHARALLAGSLLNSIGSLRYTLLAQEFVALTPAELGELFGPAMQRFLDGPLPDALLAAEEDAGA